MCSLIKLSVNIELNIIVAPIHRKGVVTRCNIYIILTALTEKVILIALTVDSRMPCLCTVGGGQSFKNVNFGRPGIPAREP